MEIATKDIVIPFALVFAACTSQVKRAEIGATGGAGAGSSTVGASASQTGAGGVASSGVGGGGGGGGGGGSGLSAACTNDVLTAVSFGAANLAVDSDYIYWTASELTDGKVWRAPKTGGAATTVSTSPTVTATAIGLALDDTTVYWAYDNGDVYSALKTGGPPSVIPIMANGVSNSLAVDDVYLYAIANDGVVKIPKAGGSAVTLASELVLTSLAIDKANVYWTDGGTVKWVPKDGGAVGQFSTYVNGAYINAPSVLAADDSGLYGVNDFCAVLKFAPVGGMMQVLVPPDKVGIFCGNQFAIDATEVYWSAGTEGLPMLNTVYSVAKTGGNPMPRVACPAAIGEPGPVAADSSSIFWTTNNPKNILRVPKQSPP